MTPDRHFDTDEMDALKEVINIGMGQAGKALSEILEGFVSLKVPDVHLVHTDELQGLIRQFLDSYEKVNSAKQAFVDQIQGEILFLYAPIAYNSLGKVLGFDHPDTITAAQKTELILDISNSLSSACLMGLGSELDLSIGLKPPGLVSLEDDPRHVLDTLLRGETPNWDHTLLIKIDFALSDIAFSCEILVFVSEDSIIPLKKAIQKLLED